MKELIRPPLKHGRIGTKQEVHVAITALQSWAEQVSRVINNLVSNIPADSTASDIAGVVTDLNALQDVIRNLETR